MSAKSKKTITVLTPAWMNTSTLKYSPSEVIDVTNAKTATIYGVKHYYCRPSWSAIPGYFRNNA